MFVFFWVMLMLLMGDSSTSAQRYCANRQCLNMEEEVSAEAGLCAVIPCSFSDFPFAGPQRILWFKCESTEECDKPVMIFHSNSQFQDGFNARISLLEYHPYSRNCSIIMNDLTELDSGSYVSRFAGKPNPYSPSIRTTVSVKALSQKPTVMVPPLTEGQRATLTCVAPGRCSGSAPKITWKWKGRGNDESLITESISSVNAEKLSGGTSIHTSTLMFEAAAYQHLTNVTCEVNFKNNISTEETVTLNINFSPKIIKTSGCKIQADSLTCVCISQGVPLPAIRWPQLENHTEYFTITTVSGYSVSSTITLSVTDYSHAVLCISNNDVGRVQQNLPIIRTSKGENGAVQVCGSNSVLPWSIAAVSLIISAVSVICMLSQWKAGQKTRAKEDNSTYMSLQKTHPTSEYDVIHQP